MKKKHFYSDHISLDEVSIELKNTEMSEEERIHLVDIASSHLHMTILNIVLTHLSTEDKKEFLKHAERNDHYKTWEFLKNKIEGIEEKIKTSAENLKKKLLKDIQKIKNKK